MSFLSRIPVFYARIIICSLYLLLLIWVLRRPKSYILREAPNKKGWRDLRIWAVILIVFQIALYVIF
jgi:hypothetical protein